MKKCIVSFILCVVMCMSMALPAFAWTPGNTNDTEYYSASLITGQWGTTGTRYKTNNTKVYVCSLNCPNSLAIFQTWCYDKNGVAVNKTINGSVLLPLGKSVITNYVFTSGKYTSGEGVEMWLEYSPHAGSGVVYGVWSPDWSETGVVEYH